jgi:hypothetical protein
MAADGSLWYPGIRRCGPAELVPRRDHPPLLRRVAIVQPDSPTKFPDGLIMTLRTKAEPATWDVIYAGFDGYQVKL